VPLPAALGFGRGRALRALRDEGLLEMRPHAASACGTSARASYAPKSRNSSGSPGITDTPAPNCRTRSSTLPEPRPSRARRRNERRLPLSAISVGDCFDHSACVPTDDCLGDNSAARWCRRRTSASPVGQLCAGERELRLLGRRRNSRPSDGAATNAMVPRSSARSVAPAPTPLIASGEGE
jgi:hypothetical protein